MSFTISIPDALRQSVEAASGGRQTVLYDNLGYPSVMSIIPAFNVQDIDADLGTGLHPAFSVNGTTKSEIFYGTYLATVHNGRALSLPGYDPTCSLNFDTAKGYCTAKGTGWHMTTNWEAAAIALYCIKYGQPRGNTDYGRHHSSTFETGRRQDGVAPGTASGTARTLTGSGPASWRHDGTLAGVSDIVGNVREWIDGMKLSTGKLYMPTDNYYTLAEASWPTDNVIIALDTTMKLGVSGTDTLHTTGNGSWKSTVGRTTAYSALSDTIKNRYMQAMIDPYFDTVNPVGTMYWDCSDERIPIRFGSWDYGANAGVAALSLRYLRSYVNTDIGFRVAYIA